MTAPKEISTNQKFGAFLGLLLGSTVIYGLILRFSLEGSSPLPSLLPLLFSIPVISYWLPVKARMYLFAIASCIGAFFILDWKNATALVLFMFAFAAFISSKLNVKMKITISFLLIALFCVLRSGIIRTPVIPFIIPVTGSLLMFRLLVLLYELKFTKPENTFIQNFSYLFLLPNLAFPLFPIIDYKSFLRKNTYEPLVVKTGISRMLLGILQLLIYRYFHNVIIPAQSTVHDAGTAFLYISTGYLAILHLTGILWLAVGYLGLLGFDLPPIFNNVFLVNGFADIWRRINIYWREYVMKLFYYPVYFRLRKKIKNPILPTALLVFTISGLLHGWQWYWLQGNVSMSSTGIIYWSILGLCITIGLTMQEKRKNAVARKYSAFLNTLRVAGMFLFMSVLWSLWNSNSVGDWLHLLSHFNTGGNSTIFFIATGIIAFGFILDLITNKFQLLIPKITGVVASWPVMIIGGILLLIFTLEEYPRFTNYIPNYSLMQDIRKDQMNLDEREEATENYYDRMLSSDGQGRRPWEMTVEAPAPKSGFELACVRRHDLVMRELIPSHTTDIGRWKIITNQWGMRDKDYSKEKSAGTFRIAVMGASYEMGSGVAQDAVFENVLETMLNDSFHGQHYEVLNFAVGGYHPAQQVWVMENKVVDFHPDMILYFVHPEDRTRNDDYMANLVHSGYELLYPELNEIRNNSGARQSMGVAELKNRFEPFNTNISEWALDLISFRATGIRAQLTVIYLPSMLTDDNSEAHMYNSFSHNNTSMNGGEWDNTNSFKNYLKRECSTTQNWPIPVGRYTPFYQGYDRNEKTHRYSFISLHGIFGNNVNEYKLSTDPTHPNTTAHSLIARELFSELYPIFRTYETH